MAQRVAEVLSLLLDGHTRSEVVRHGSKKWKISSRQIDDYIALANKELEEINKVTLDKNIALITKNLWKQYREAQRSSDKIQALKELARIKGIGSTNISLTVDDTRELSSLTDEELEKLYGTN